MQNPYNDPWDPDQDGNNNSGENPGGGGESGGGSGGSNPYSPCAPGLVKCRIRADGTTDGRTDECVTPEECSRRQKLFYDNIPKNGGGNNTPPADNTKPPAPPPSKYDELNSEILKMYREMYGKNIPAPYDAATIARLEGKAKAVSESTKARQNQQYLAGRSAMGLGNTGRTKQGMRNIAMEADANMGQQAIDINHAAIKANYQAEVANIERKLSSLNAMSQFAVALASNETQRQAIQNSYTIQIMQLRQQLEELKLKIVMGAY